MVGSGLFFRFGVVGVGIGGLKSSVAGWWFQGLIRCSSFPQRPCHTISLARLPISPADHRPEACAVPNSSQLDHCEVLAGGQRPLACGSRDGGLLPVNSLTRSVFFCHTKKIQNRGSVIKNLCRVFRISEQGFFGRFCGIVLLSAYSLSPLFGEGVNACR
mgnify:CR=1 FL=1